MIINLKETNKKSRTFTIDFNLKQIRIIERDNLNFNIKFIDLENIELEILELNSRYPREFNNSIRLILKDNGIKTGKLTRLLA